MSDVTFSDGTFIPKGTLVFAAARHVHLKSDNYTDPDIFDPLRFIRDETNISVAQSFMTPRADYLAFGMGKHAW